MASDNVLAGISGGLQGINDALGTFVKYKLQRKLKEQEDYIGSEDIPDDLRQEIGIEPGQRIRKEILPFYTPTQVWNPETKSYETVSKFRSKVAATPTVKPTKQFIKKSELLNRTAKGEALDPAEFQVVDDSPTLARELRDQTLQDKREAELQKIQVPGYALGGKVRPSVPEATKARDAVARFDKFEKGINALKLYVDKHGSFQAFGEAGANMNALATDLQLDAKELYNLGVLNGPDLMLIQKAIADPSSLKSLFTRESSRKAELDRVLTQMRQGVSSKMGSMGYASEAAVGEEGFDFNGITDAQRKALEALEQ